MIRRPPISTLFPSTPLFLSQFLSQATRLSATPDGLVRCFQDADYSQSCNTVVEWFRISLDAPKEIGGLGAERFNLLNLGSPHVAGAIADEQLMQVAGI